MKCLRFPRLQNPVSSLIHFESFSFSCVQSVQYRILKFSFILLARSRVCLAHVSSLLLQFSVIFHLGLSVSATSETKRTYSRVRTNNCKHQAQNEQCHERHTTSKEIKRNLTSTHSENTNKRSNQKLYNLKVSARSRNILTTVSI